MKNLREKENESAETVAVIVVSYVNIVLTYAEGVSGKWQKP